jgi:hypothetical protein
LGRSRKKDKEDHASEVQEQEELPQMSIVKIIGVDDYINLVMQVGFSIFSIVT